VEPLTKEELIDMNHIRLKKGELCNAIPNGMKLCCHFERIEGMEDDFSDGSGY
jgi:hypothetical protein